MWNKTFNVDIDFIRCKLHLKIAYSIKKAQIDMSICVQIIESCSQKSVAKGEDRWMDGWVDSRTSLRIAYSNQ